MKAGGHVTPNSFTGARIAPRSTRTPAYCRSRAPTSDAKKKFAHAAGESILEFFEDDAPHLFEFKSPPKR